MKIEILGAGGAASVPRAFSTDPASEEARRKGAPYTRYGPSLFIHDLSLLIDTPEEIAIQLNRAGILRVDAVLYSHWHPDHTAGIRIWESNFQLDSPLTFPLRTHCTTMYLPANVAETFSRYHDLTAKVDYMEGYGIISRQIVPDGASFTLNGVQVTPFVLAEQYVCGFVFDWCDNSQARRILICMDELNRWRPPAWLGHLDLAILPAGVFEFHPLTGRRAIEAGHPFLAQEATFGETLDVVSQLDVDRVVFGHLNASDGLTFDQYLEVARRLGASASLPPVEFAYDTMVIEV